MYVTFGRIQALRLDMTERCGSLRGNDEHQTGSQPAVERASSQFTINTVKGSNRHYTQVILSVLINTVMLLGDLPKLISYRCKYHK